MSSTLQHWLWHWSRLPWDIGCWQQIKTKSMYISKENILAELPLPQQIRCKIMILKVLKSLIIHGCILVRRRVEDHKLESSCLCMTECHNLRIGNFHSIHQKCCNMKKFSKPKKQIWLQWVHIVIVYFAQQQKGVSVHNSCQVFVTDMIYQYFLQFIFYRSVSVLMILTPECMLW